jgi:serine/threonine-protein kinase Stk1
LQRPAQVPLHCWQALRTALAFDESQRQIDCSELLDAFRRPPASPLRRWLGKA